MDTKRDIATKYSSGCAISRKNFAQTEVERRYLAANSMFILSRIVCSRAFIIEFLTYVRRMAMAIRREVALFAKVLIWRLRDAGTYSKAISGMMVIHEVQSTIRIRVSSEPDSK